MLYKLFNQNNDIVKIVLNILSVIFLCFFTSLFAICISAYIIVHLDFSYQFLTVLTTAILAFSAIIDAFIISRVSKENGLFWGIIVGLTISVILMIISVIYGTFALNTNLLTKITIIVASGAISGIIGVNIN